MKVSVIGREVLIADVSQNRDGDGEGYGGDGGG